MSEENTPSTGTQQGAPDADPAAAAAAAAQSGDQSGAAGSDQTPPTGEPGTESAAATAPQGEGQPPAAGSAKGKKTAEKESGKAGATTPPTGVPGVEQKESGPKVMRIKNNAYAGMSVYGVSGKAAVFNSDGIAEVGADDHAYFLQVPGYEEA